MSDYLDIGPLQKTGAGPGPDIGPLQSNGSGGGGNLTQTTTPQITLTAFNGTVAVSGVLTQVSTPNIILTAFNGSLVGSTLTQTATPHITLTAFSGAFSFRLNQLYTAKINLSAMSGALIFSINAFTLFIDGLDVSSLGILVNTMQITQPLGQAATASFCMWDKSGTQIVPQVGQAVQIFHGTTCIFGGSVDQPVQTAFQALPGHLFSGSGGGASAASGGATGVGSATGGGVSASGSSGGIQCTDWSNMLTRRYVGQYYFSPAFLTSVVSNIVELYLSQDGFTVEFPDGDPGFDLGPLLFNWVTVQAAFNTLCSASGWEFSVDYFKVIRFYNPENGTGAAPFNIADNDGNELSESLSVEYFRSMYRNKQGIISPTQSSYLWSDIFSASQPGPYPSSPQPPDGIRRFFVELYPFTALPVVTVNGIAQDVVLLSQISTSPGYQWYITDPAFSTPPSSFGLSQNPANTPLQSTDVLIISYATQISPIYWVQNDTQINERAAIEGNSGVYENVMPAPSTTDPGAIQVYALGLLNRYGANGIPYQVSYSTLKAGLFAGQTQNIVRSNPELNLIGGQITEVTINDVDGQFLNYSITVASALYQNNKWTQWLQAMINGATMAQPSAFATYNWNIAPTVPGVTNPGVSGPYDTPAQLPIQNAVELVQSMTVTLPVAIDSEAQFELVLEPTHDGILVVTFATGTSGTQTVNSTAGSPVRIYGGQGMVIQVGGVTGVDTVKDVQVTVVTAIAVT